MTDDQRAAEGEEMSPAQLQSRTRLAALVSQLANQRRLMATLKLRWIRRQTKLKNECAGLVRDLAAAVTEVADLEQMVRDHATGIHMQHADKAPAPGVMVKAKKEYEYDPEEALAWAISERNLNLVALNVGEFKKICRTALRPAFVEEKEDRGVTIAKDLNVLYPQGEEETP